ncbi:MAG: recombinase family protein [Planctomycetaceae bacterium]
MTKTEITAAALIPAVAYYRMSSERQEASIPQQMQAVERYAAENGYRIIRDYRDEGISGDATERRFGFQKMVLDAARGDFRAILSWDQDRLGRFDPIEAGFWLTPLRNAHTRLVTVNQGEIDLDDFAGQIVYSVTQAAKHAFLKDLAKSIARGKFHSASSGGWPGGTAPLGYQVVDGKLTPEPEEAAIVLRIFADYDAGHSLRSIADRLNRDGVVPLLKRRYANHPRAAAKWTGKVVGAILANQANVGTFRYNVAQSGKYARVRDGSVAAVRRGEAMTRNNAHAIVIENAHEALIDRKTFDRVSRKLKSNRKRTSRITTPYALTGLCRCAHCGGRMTYSTRRWNDRSYRYLACYQNLAQGPSVCRSRTIREDTVLPTVLGVMRERLSNPENAQRLRRELESLCSERSAPTDLERLRREVVTLEDDIAKARRRVVEVDADMLNIVQDHLRELRRRHEETSGRITELEWRAAAKPDDINATVEKAIDAATRLVEKLNRTDSRLLREAMAESIERIDLWIDGRPSQRSGLTQRYHLARGTIVLRGDDSFSRIVTTDRTRRQSRSPA